MRIHDSLTRYLIQSESRPEQLHLVDIKSHNCIGECSCEQFNLQIRPKITEAIEALEAGQKFEPENPDNYRCKHIRKIREQLINTVIEHYAEISSTTNE